jgi:hypothetical protein
MPEEGLETPDTRIMIPIRRADKIPAYGHLWGPHRVPVQTRVQTIARLLSRSRGGSWRFAAVGCDRLRVGVRGRRTRPGARGCGAPRVYCGQLIAASCLPFGYG